MKKATKTEIKTLIKKYALMKYSRNSTCRIQQKFYDSFYNYLEKFSNKYPYIDMKSDSFFSDLEFQATKWWRSRPFSGPGVDW